MKKLLSTCTVFLLVLCLLSVCCKPVNYVAVPKLDWTFHADVRFNALEREAMQAACRNWGTHTNGLIHCAFIFDTDFRNPPPANVRKMHFAFKGRSDSETVQELESQTGGALLGVETQGNLLLVMDRLNEGLNASAVITVVTEHELGHAFGMDHTGFGNIMQTGFDVSKPVPQWGPEDQNQCQELGYCR